MQESRLTVTRVTLAKTLDLVVWISGGMLILLGSVVLLGWYTQNAFLVHINLNIAPLQYNAALSFLLCGLALLALPWGQTRLGLVCSMVAAAIGLLTLYEDLFELSLGLDQYFLQPFTTIRTSHPGRMAPQTALSFFLTGTALVVLGLSIRHELTLLISGLLGVMVCGFGVVASIGYLAGVPSAHSWQPFSGMAAPAAVGCVVLGLGVIAAAWRHYDELSSGVLPWTPMLVGIGVTAVTLGLWQTLLAREQGLIKHTVSLAAAGIQDAITEQIVSRLRSLERMAQHWESERQIPRTVWEHDVALARRHDPYLRNIAWVDPSFQVLWLAPLADDDVLSDTRLGVRTRQRWLLERARETQEVQVMRVGDASQAPQELWVAVPLFEGVEFRGCLVGMLGLQPLLTQIASKVVEDFALIVLEDNDLVYAHRQSALRYQDTLGQDMVIHLPGLTWRGWLWPTAAVLTHQFFVLPFAGLLMGFVTAVLLVSMIYYAQTAQLHATQLTVTNEALRESYQFLQSTLDALSVSLVIVAETGTIVAVNASWSLYVAAHGLPASSHGVGTNYLEFCRAVNERAATVEQDITTGMRAVMAREQTTFSYEYTCYSTAEPSWFLMRMTRFDGTEGVRVVVAHEEISEIKRAEDTLRRQQEALAQSEKLAAMSGLLASVAHELNNPLAVIMVQSDVLREHVTDSDVADLATDIHQSAVRCERIVRNFLSLVRPNMPERTQVQLNEIIAEIMPLLSYTLQLDDITVSQHLAEDLPVLWGDPHQLQQVVVNLVTNAQQAVHETPPPHHITIATRYDTALQQIRLEVVDTGPGVPPELQTRIFEPFFTTKPSGIGTGLGLPLCQSIVAGHGGRLSVASQTGQGACFVVELPVGEAGTSVPTAPEPVHLTPVTGKTLLVVDDEVGTAKALVRLFRRDGHTVDTAGNGHAALAQLRIRAYDLILCDLRMPQLDGPGLYRLVAQEQPHLLQRFIFLTGDTLSPAARTFLAESHAPYLVKPFRVAALRQVVQQTLQRFETS